MIKLRERRLCLGVAALLCSACGAQNVVEPTRGEEDALYFVNDYDLGVSWPGRSVPVCWNTSSVGRSDFATMAPLVQAALWRSWVQATGLRFSGWQSCPANTDGMMVVTLKDTGASNADRGYRPDEKCDVVLNVGSRQQSFMMEFGHCLGFAHEMARPDFVDDATGSCREANRTGSALNTLPDRTSVMAEGYCRKSPRLSYWDEVGVQKCYGHRNHFVDVTGDGRADAIKIGSSGIVVRPGTLSGPFGSATTWAAGVWEGDKGNFFADVTGDGRADLIAVDDDGVKVARSTGSSFQVPWQAWTGAWWGELETHFADVTGDGKADLIGIDSTVVAVRRSTGSGFSSTESWGGQWSSQQIGLYGTFLVDVGGSVVGNYAADGRADMVLIQDDGVWIRKSRGSYFDAPERWLTSPWYGERVTAMADLNNDGRADLIGVDNNGVLVRRSTGNGFGSTETWISGAWYGERGTFFADVNESGAWGKADIIAVDNNGVMVRRSNGTTFLGSTNATGGAFFADRIDEYCGP